MSNYDPKNPPPEPDLGTVVKDRHGALSMRQKYAAQDGWGDPWGGTMPFGKWDAMWEARGPLEEVPHPRYEETDRIAASKETENKDGRQHVYLVVQNDNGYGRGDVLVAFTDESLAEEMSDGVKGSVVRQYPVLTAVPSKTILYRQRSGGTVVAVKCWDFEVDERLKTGWCLTVEGAFQNEQ